MWDDPFLQHHEIANRRYELSTPKFQWISVHDQITRATMMVDRLIARDVVPRKNGRLLVVGGGVTGVSAALHAVESKVDVTLLEQHPDLFSMFAACTTRRIDPHLYRWPAVGWDDSRWSLKTPLCSRVVGQPGKEFVPAKLVKEWISKVAHYESKYKPKLHILREAKLLTHSWGKDGLPQAAYEVRGTIAQQTVHAILYAIGLGTEQTYLDNQQGEFTGPLFWSKDDFQFEQSELGLPVRPRALISGSGDGALQDYIRLLTGKHPAELITLLESALKGETKWYQAKLAILSAQDDAERALVLGIRPPEENIHKMYVRYEDSINRVLNRRIQAQVDSIYDWLTPATAKVERTLERIAKERPFLNTLHLALRGDEITWSYPLNRFLVLLLSRYMSENGFQTVFPQARLKLVESQLPPHRVTFVDRASPDLYEEYDIVLLRFGIIPHRCLYETDQPMMRRLRIPHPPLVSLERE